MRKLKFLITLLILFLWAALPAAAQNSKPTVNLEALASQLTLNLSTGNKKAALALMNSEMQAALSGNKLDDIWLYWLNRLGAFERAQPHNAATIQHGYHIIETPLLFSRGSVIQRVVFDQNGLIAGLFFINAQIKNPETTSPPPNIREISATINSTNGITLKGLLTLPNGNAPFPAVVLIHGSGPLDMDETIGANKPFADLANGLAQQGIAVLRYEKRTYAYGAASYAQKDTAAFTVDDETALDAVAAVRFLKEHPEINAKQVYLLGHSLGGGLLAYIDQMGAHCAGYVLMAASPRKLWELSAEQNLRLAQEMELTGDVYTAAWLRALTALFIVKAQNLMSLSEHDALKAENAIFGISAYYLRHLTAINAAALHLADKKPMLILQGGKDRQITATDFELWQKELARHSNVTFHFYPALNHLMGQYNDKAVPFAQIVVQEYAARTPVANEVINDIACWLKINYDM